ncbi:hypothetical protein Hanom_Chr11g00967551 [Helianthus anomalus]
MIGYLFFGIRTSVGWTESSFSTGRYVYGCWRLTVEASSRTRTFRAGHSSNICIAKSLIKWKYFLRPSMERGSAMRRLRRLWSSPFI